MNSITANQILKNINYERKIKMEILNEIQENWKLVLLSIIIAIFLISLNNAQAAAAVY